MSTPNRIKTTDPLPRKLNLGCGFDYRAGWLNVDLQSMHEPDIVADVTALPMLDDGAFEEILAQDVLEHFERAKTVVALAEWSRLLAPNGVLQLRVPSLFGMFELLAQPDRRDPDRAEEIIHLMYGTQAYTGDYHLAGFTAATLARHLANAGMLVCEAQIKDQWLFDVKARKATQLPDDREFLHYAYFEILHRPADPAGLDGYLGVMSSGEMDRERVVASLAQSEEARLLEKYPAYLVSYLQRFR